MAGLDPAIPLRKARVPDRGHRDKPGDDSRMQDDNQPNLPWQCLNFLPEPQGQFSLRPTLPQVAGLFGSRSAGCVGGDDASCANDISSSPVFGSYLCASIAGSSGCCSGGTISTRINCAVTTSFKFEIIV